MFQQVIVIGNLGSEPELRYTPSGVPVLSMSVATNRRWLKGDEWQEKTVWFKVTVWQDMADRLSQKNLQKGQQVMVLGEMEEPSVWTAKDGTQRASLELTARQVKVLGPQDAETRAQMAEPNMQDDSGIPF